MAASRKAAGRALFFRILFLPDKQHKMFKKPAVGFAILLALTLTALQSAHAAMVNGGFELPSFGPAPLFHQIPQGTVPGWRTTASDGQIEIWNNGFGGFASYEGTQHAEVNATRTGTLYQDVPGIPAGVVVGFQFAHRGRYAVADVMRFTLTDLGADNAPGGGDDTVLYTQAVTDSTAWRFYTGTGITTLGNTVRFTFATISSGGLAEGGNFIDAADFGFGVGGGGAPAPVPTLSEWGMILLSMLLAFGAVLALRRSRH